LELTSASSPSVFNHLQIDLRLIRFDLGLIRCALPVQRECAKVMQAGS
jgi:hypothetical protein